jgi:hypothetical protein
MVVLKEFIIQKGFFDKSPGPPGANFFSAGESESEKGRPCLNLDSEVRFPQIDKPPGRVPPDDLTGQV